MDMQSTPDVSTNQPPPEPVEPVVKTEKKSRTPGTNFPLTVILLVLVVLVSYMTVFLVRERNEQNLREALRRSTTPMPFYLTIDSPRATVAAINGEILVSGRTLPETTVMVYSDSDESITDSGPDGKFESTVLVGNNGGLVRITAISSSGEEKSETFSIDGSNGISISGESDVLGKSNIAPGQAKKTESGTSNALKSNPGIGEPKTKSTPTVKQNKQISVTPAVKTNTVVKKFLETKKVSENPKKIGTLKMKELLASESTSSSASGVYRNLKKFTAREATSTATLKRHALSGVITGVAEGTLTIAHLIQRDRIYTVFYNVNTVITSKNGLPGSAFSVGMRVACVGEPIEGGLLAKQIHIIPGKAVGAFNKHPVATEGGIALLTPSPEATDSASATPSSTPVTTVTDTPLPPPSETPIPTL